MRLFENICRLQIVTFFKGIVMILWPLQRKGTNWEFYMWICFTNTKYVFNNQNVS